MFTSNQSKEKQPKAQPENNGDESGEDDEDVEKEVVGNWKIVDLPQLPKVTGEEEEEEVAKYRTKVYRYRGEWKERGVGQLRFLKHKATGYIRILVRAEKTHKCIMNHFVIQKDVFCKLEPLKTSKNAWMWAAYDISDESPASQKFAAKFTSKEDYEAFQKEFEKTAKVNAGIAGQKKEEKVEEKVEAKVQA